MRKGVCPIRRVKSSVVQAIRRTLKPIFFQQTDQEESGLPLPSPFLEQLLNPLFRHRQTILANLPRMRRNGKIDILRLPIDVPLLN
ncbi:MAG: hypothetical protein CBD18_07695 [Opitutales bacterium TMED158]|nr:MAG: hypothetical protein CBD18_07695 [Opitutales bacterium TMED158]